MFYNSFAICRTFVEIINIMLIKQKVNPKRSKKHMKYCIFNEKKICDDCNECNVCDLNPKKKCNNCCKCLELEGYDMKAIKIDEILENEEDLEEYETKEYNTNSYMKNEKIQESTIEFIDDIDGLREILDNKSKFNKMIHEEYPGLIKINNKKIH